MKSKANPAVSVDCRRSSRAACFRTAPNSSGEHNAKRAHHLSSARDFDDLSHSAQFWLGSATANQIANQLGDTGPPILVTRRRFRGFGSDVGSRRDTQHADTHHNDGNEITATLTDNATSRDFVSMLPLKSKLEDYGETEKIGYLPRKLSTEGASAGSDPSIGDVSYYAPWGNLAIFRQDFRYLTGLINVGKIASGLEALEALAPVEVTIDLVK